MKIFFKNFGQIASKDNGSKKNWHILSEVGVQKHSQLSEVSQLRSRPASLHRLGLCRLAGPVRSQLTSLSHV
jgi:hypothetical protein